MTPEPHDKILLVEGRDDREVVFQFCNHHGIDNKRLFAVKDKDGLDSLLDDLRLRLRTGVAVVGVLVDADADPGARWQRLASVVRPLGYRLPDAPTDAGTLLASPGPARPRLGIWMMPDNQVEGMLEDFLLRLVHEHDPLVIRARDVVAGIPVAERRFGPTYGSKAIVHTWLAWQEEPGTALGQAITKRYLDPARAPAPAFRAWLLELFGSPAPEV
jgi:hypothetical protein